MSQAKTCTECRRRKQKCSGAWPCQRCTARHLAHGCHFEIDHASQRNTINSEKSVHKQDGQSESGTSDASVPPLDPSALGYTNDLDHLDLADLISDISKQSGQSINNDIRVSDLEMQTALKALPTRSFTDSLVNHYLLSTNYTYYAIHVEAFRQDYASWCDASLRQKKLFRPFACLLLQICANAAQDAPDALSGQIEYEYGESCEDVSTTLNSAATRLSKTILPGKGGPHQILQLLIAAAWAKSRGQKPLAWHSLAAAVHELQEYDMSCARAPSVLKEIDIEIKTRLWCYAILWDWQMAEWLSRPMLTRAEGEKVRLPNLDIDRPAPDVISPFASTFHQYRLACMLVSTFGCIGETRNVDIAIKIHQIISTWTTDLPPQLAIDQPDVSKDAQFSWISTQRAQIHCFMQMVRFTPMKYFMTHSMNDPTIHNLDEARKLAVSTCLECLYSALRLSEMLPLQRTRFHFALFALFDTAATICSALLHDRQEKLASREQLVEAVALAINALQKFSPSSVAAAGASELLRRLVFRLKLASTESRVLYSLLQPSNVCDSEIASPSNSMTATLVPPAIPSDDNIPGIEAPASQATMLDMLTFDSMMTDVNTNVDIDLGAFGDIWDFDSLGLGRNLQR